MDYSRWAEMQYHKPLNPNPSSVDPYSHLYDADHSSSYAHYPYNTLNLPDPRTLLNRQEISSAQYKVGPEPGLGPPGIDSYAAINSYPPPPPTHVGYEAQAAITYGQHAAQISASTAAAYYPETGAAVQNWAAKEAIRQFGADPVSYAAVSVACILSRFPFLLKNKEKKKKKKLCSQSKKKKKKKLRSQFSTAVAYFASHLFCVKMLGYILNYRFFVIWVSVICLFI
ncbi:hypothetical protein NE237_005874 [Protea cynaroides]|uniref:Uncharacterized protein n=1 Tax=Protea cynaroides TaxID=273540 RepID=A0A9Q0QUM5_9MAGN|nr:hypothetical protein NE237_005874 [Protea cynaroides]